MYDQTVQQCVLTFFIGFISSDFARFGMFIRFRSFHGDKKLKKEKSRWEKVHLKIAWVEVIRTLGGSGEIYTVRDGSQLPIDSRLSRMFDIAFIRHPSICEYISSKKLLLYKLKFSFGIIRYLFRHNPDLLVTTGMPHVEGFIAFAVSKLLRRPILLRETHWYWPSTFTAKLVWPINLWLTRKTTLLIVPGKRVKKYWELVGINPSKIKIVPFYTSSLEADSYVTALAEVLRSRFRDRIILLCLGRLVKVKGIDYLIKAFAELKEELPNSTLIIAGDGPERSNLENLSKSMGLNDVVFLGAVGREMQRYKPAYFMMADIYVCPSVTLKTPEEWSLGVIEAMSVGKPVVATTATGCALDVIRNGVNGYIVRERDPEALYKAIKTIAKDANLRKSMGIESKRVVESIFNYDCAVQAMVQAIKSVYE